MGFCRVEFWENSAVSDRTSSKRKTDPLMPKTEAISNIGNTYVTMYLRKGKELCAAAVREGSDNGRKNSSDAKVSEEEEVGRVLGDGAEIPLQLMEKFMLEQMSTHGEDHGEQTVPLNLWGSMLEQITIFSPWISPLWNRWSCSEGNYSLWSLTNS